MASSSSSRPEKKAKCETESTLDLGPNWLELPAEVTAKIFHKLTSLENFTSFGALETFTTVTLVCRSWWKICKDPLMWRTIDLTNSPRETQECQCCINFTTLPPNARSKLIRFCRNAIERSCGQLEDISIEDFGTDEILQCIGDSGSHLRRMRLSKCCEMSDKRLSEVVKKLPLLEEFETSFIHLSKDTLELMGKSCPHLKVLKFNMKEQKGFEYDDEAFAIAKTMPQLRHLQLLGNRLTNKGLLAILDGCPNLESLDLRVCSNVDLSGSLRKRCIKQLRDLRFPEDSSEVYIYVDRANEMAYEDLVLAEMLDLF